MPVIPMMMRSAVIQTVQHASYGVPPACVAVYLLTYAKQVRGCVHHESYHALETRRGTRAYSHTMAAL